MARLRWSHVGGVGWGVGREISENGKISSWALERCTRKGEKWDVTDTKTGDKLDP